MRDRDDDVLRTMIVDDEPLAIERMQVLCAELSGLSVVGTASDGAAALRLDGQVFAIFVIVLAAAEAAVALAIFLNFYNNFSTIDVERAQNLKG